MTGSCHLDPGTLTPNNVGGEGRAVAHQLISWSGPILDTHLPSSMISSQFGTSPEMIDISEYLGFHYEIACTQCSTALHRKQQENTRRPGASVFLFFFFTFEKVLPFPLLLFGHKYVNDSLNKFFIVTLLAESGKGRDCSTNTSVIHSFIN